MIWLYESLIENSQILRIQLPLGLLMESLIRGEWLRRLCIYNEASLVRALQARYLLFFVVVAPQMHLVMDLQCLLPTLAIHDGCEKSLLIWVQHNRPCLLARIVIVSCITAHHIIQVLGLHEEWTAPRVLHAVQTYHLCHCQLFINLFLMAQGLNLGLRQVLRRLELSKFVLLWLDFNMILVVKLWQDFYWSLCIIFILNFWFLLYRQSKRERG